MHPSFRAASAILLLAGLLLAALLPAARPAQAETFHTCTGFIDSLPATISTQGTWCMRADLGTAMATGAAITIAANNVTIDCNEFKLGGLAAGDGTLAVGIRAQNRQNARIRHCNVRGFLRGTELTGSGHAVQDSRFYNNTARGIHIAGDGLFVRGNQVNDTGGSTQAAYPDAVGIYVGFSNAGKVVDNVVNGVYGAEAGDGLAYGVLAFLSSGDVAGNTVTLLRPGGAGHARGISSQHGPTNLVIRDNVVGMGTGQPIVGTGVYCNGATARDNAVGGMTTGYEGCASAGGNFTN